MLKNQIDWQQGYLFFKKSFLPTSFRKLYDFFLSKLYLDLVFTEENQILDSIKHGIMQLFEHFMFWHYKKNLIKKLRTYIWI